MSYPLRVSSRISIRSVRWRGQADRYPLDLGFIAALDPALAENIAEPVIDFWVDFVSIFLWQHPFFCTEPFSQTHLRAMTCMQVSSLRSPPWSQAGSPQTSLPRTGTQCRFRTGSFAAENPSALKLIVCGVGLRGGRLISRVHAREKKLGSWGVVNAELGSPQSVAGEQISTPTWIAVFLKWKNLVLIARALRCLSTSGC